MSAYTKNPELPTIEDFNLLMEVLSHKDIQSTSSGEWGNERLAELGEQVLNHVVTFHYFSKHPLVRAEELRVYFVLFSSRCHLTS